MRDKTQELLIFIAGYESPEPPQSIDAIKGDFQLAGLMTALNKAIAQRPDAKLIDIGCGNGVLFAKLHESGLFAKHNKLQYEGYDKEEVLPSAFESSSRLKLLTRTRFYPLQEWQNNLDNTSIIVCRNVLHELSIQEASELISSLAAKVHNNTSIFVQDMTTLPVAEKLKCGWIGAHLEEVLKDCGFETILTPDISKKGIDVYLIEGKRKRQIPMSVADICARLLSARQEQLKALQSKYVMLEEKPENTLPTVRLNHDITTLSLQIGILSDLKNDDIIATTFALAFKTITISDFSRLRANFRYPEIKWFQNRGREVQAIDDFLREKKTILLIVGPKYIGKKSLTWHALNKKQHNRMPLFLEVSTGISIFNVLESLGAQLEISKFIDIEMLSGLKSFPVDKLLASIKDIVSAIASNSILILNNFETILNPENNIANDHVAAFVNSWSNVDGAKIVIQCTHSVKEMSGANVKKTNMSVFKSRDDSPRFGKYLYSVQMLQEIVPIEYRDLDSNYGGFPYDLLLSLENHPYFLYLAATAIKNNANPSCLKDPEFIFDLKVRIADTLFSQMNLDEPEREQLLALTLIKDGFPLELLTVISGAKVLGTKLISNGVIFEVKPNNFKALDIVTHINKETKEGLLKGTSEKSWHSRFQQAFQNLYRKTSNPEYYRQSLYHAMNCGEKVAVTPFNLAEVTKCTETWYSQRHLVDALWGYQEIKKHRKLLPREAMREASCLTRTGSIKEGREAYTLLIKAFPKWDGVKNSFIDSLIASGECAQEALTYLEKVPAEKRDFYWHRQSARAYRQVPNRKESYSHYAESIVTSTYELAIEIIDEVSKYALSNSDFDVVANWDKYLARLKEASRAS